MRIDEFFKQDDVDKLPYDVCDDLQYHMLNDTMFYRKHYLPAIEKCKSDYNEDVIQRHIMPMINAGCNHYVLKYDLSVDPKTLISPEEKVQLAQNIVDYEKNPPEEMNASKKII